jgi:hypothetical protein
MKPGKVAPAGRYFRNTGQLALAEHWEAELQKARRCRRCGRLLTDPVSLGRGVGPDCWQKGNR